VTQIGAGDSAHGEGHLLVTGASAARPGPVLPEASDLGRAAIVQRLLLLGAAIAAVALAAALVIVIAVRRRRRRAAGGP
jgi:hypothetical protein